jgi:hypothetical protein
MRTRAELGAAGTPPDSVTKTLVDPRLEFALRGRLQDLREQNLALRARAPDLASVLGGRGDIIAFVGGGGKTSLMFALASQLAARDPGRRGPPHPHIPIRLGSPITRSVYSVVRRHPSSMHDHDEDDGAAVPGRLRRGRHGERRLGARRSRGRAAVCWQRRYATLVIQRQPPW